MRIVPLSWSPARGLLAGLCLLGGLAAAATLQAAKADKPEKPFEKPDKFEKPVEKPDKIKPAKIEKIERALKSERSARPEASGRGAEGRPSSAPPPAAPATAAAGFEPFRLIVDRNIFNPNRTGRSRVSEEAAPRVDQLALVGTMESEQGLLAFFDSADAAWQKTVRVGDTVAGFTVKEITASGVQLASGEKTFGLRVNQQLRRVEGGEWRVNGRDLARAELARPASEPAAPPAAPAVPANASEVLRRLMEQRQKQLKQ